MTRFENKLVDIARKRLPEPSNHSNRYILVPILGSEVGRTGVLYVMFRKAVKKGRVLEKWEHVNDDKGMKEIILKYRSWHKDTDHSWKVAVIELCKKDNIMDIDNHRDIDWLYDDCIDRLTSNSIKRIINLAKSLGYQEPPCHHCRMMIKHWNNNEDVKWSPDSAHLFEKQLP